MNPKAPVRSKKVRVYLFVATLLWAIALVLSFVPAMMSAMIFDAPGSEKVLTNWIMFWAMFSFPVVIMAAILASWIFYFLKKNYLAIFSTALPFINILIVAIALVMYS